MDSKDQASGKSLEADGYVLLKGSNRPYEYNTNEWIKEDANIEVGMKDEASQTAVTTCARQEAVIGATIFNYDVEAPGIPSRNGGFLYGVTFKRPKGA
jgi:hypothetical protein